DPYLIAPTLKLAVAQRLARRLCPDTGEVVEVDGSMQTMFDKEFESLPAPYHDRIPTNKTVMYPEPSPGCTSGTKGRVAVMETLEVSGEIQQLILNSAPEEEVYREARSNGFMSMKEDAIIKALEGVIPYQEISVFGTKVGEENVVTDEYLPVDNPEESEEGAV
ncbi:MAG: hypothetical protein AAFO91_19170, partial [Bacteroidota bacterium]